MNIDVLDMMVCTDFYTLNQALREGRSESWWGKECGSWTDYHLGWTRQEAIKETSLLFYDVWRAGVLGSEQGRVGFRGCTFTRQQLDRIIQERILVDAGYSFATPNLGTALAHLDHQKRSIKRVYSQDDELVPTLLEIITGRLCLYIPGEGEADPLKLRSGMFTSGLMAAFNCLVTGELRQKEIQPTPEQGRGGLNDWFDTSTYGQRDPPAANEDVRQASKVGN